MEEMQEESLADEMRSVVEEARMVIPGAQALLGFQTIAAFNTRYEALPASGVLAHLLGLALLALAIALLMTPAALHRMSERGRVSSSLISISSGLVAAGMACLMLAIAVDMYLVCLASLNEQRIALITGGLALLVFACLWFLFPWLRRRARQGE